MMPAGKHFDPVLGVDIHIIQPPGPVPPVPIPHPFVGMIIDPMDYVPFIGATVNVNGLPRSQAGTAGEAMPKHIPIGGTFIKPPANECEIFMGSSTVCVDGDAFNYLALPVLSCHDVGLVPPPRPKKKSKTKSMVLPTCVVLCVPGGPPVLVGGPPTISLMALGMRIGMAGLGKAFKKFSKKFKKFRKKKGKGKKPKKGKSADNAPCGTDAHPVDVVTGACVDTCIDFISAAPFPLRWIRHYDSGDAARPSPIGAGFRHEYQRTLERTPDGFIYTDERGLDTAFPPLPDGASTVAAEGLVLRRIDDAHFQIVPYRKPSLLFEFRAPNRPAVLTRLSAPRDSLEFGHDAAGRLVEIRESRGDTYQLRHDEAGRIQALLRATADGSQTIVRYEYSTGGCLTAAIDAFDQRQAYAYDGQKRLTRLTNRNNYTFTYDYDQEGRVVRTRGQDGLWEASFEYQPEVGLTKVTYMDGGVWTKAYNADGLITAVIDPFGGQLHREIGGDGLVVSETDAAGHTTQFLYNLHGAAIGKRDHLGHFSLPYAEEPFPDDPLAPWVPTTPAQWEYGQLLPPQALREGPLPPRDQERFSRAGAVSGAAPAAARATPTPPQHDALGRVVARTQPDGTTERWTYDPEGRPVQLESNAGHGRRWQYRSWNLVAHEFDALGAKTSFGYSFRGEITKVTDPGETKTLYERDQKERITKVSRQGILRDEYVWDAGDRLIEKKDGQGRTLARIEPGPTGLPAKRILPGNEVHSFKHDDRGRLLAAVSPAGKVTFGYSPKGHRTADLRDGLGAEHQFRDGRLVATTVLGKFRTRYAHPEPGTIEILDPTGARHVIRFSKAGYVERLLGNGSTESVRYNRDGLCLAKVATPRQGPARTTRWTYGPGRQLLEAGDAGDQTTRFSYDAAGRLSAVSPPGGPPQAIAYDAAGNLTAKPGAERIAIGPANQVQSANDERFAHNERHHVAEVRGPSGTTRFTYDARDQLTEVESHDQRWTAAYDALGRRTRKAWRSFATEFHWDGERLIAEIQKDGRTRVYVYADEHAIVPFLFVDFPKPDAQPSQGVRHYIFTNQIGVPVRIENDAGQAVWSARIEPYGGITIDPASSIAFHLRFPGHYHDPEIGLHYNRHRYYSPRLGRYFQSDPIGLAGGLNLYAYPANPLTQVDVNGLSCDGPANKANSPDAEKPPKRQEVKKGEDVSDIAAKSGMEKEHLEKLSKRSQESGDIIVVRASNPESLKYHGKPGHVSKPLDCKLKTAKPPDPHAGLVKKPANPTDADLKHIDELEKKGWTFDKDGVAHDPNGNKVYGDHDLQGVYHKDEFADAHHKVNTNDPDFQKGLNDDVCPENQMFNHGANDNYKKDGKMGRQPDADEKFVITEPDGTVRHIDGTDELQRYYTEKGIPWPYNNFT